MKECYVFTKDKTNCAGCGACVLSCRHGALCSKEDEEGFLYPELDKEKCIKCGLCNKICPINTSQENPETKKCILATTNYKEYSSKSATIGLCTMLAQAIIKQQGVVCGAWLNERTWTVEHILIHDIDSLEKIRNSKYAQSEVGEIYQDVRTYLIKGIKVLFVGTPCQVAGLKAYLHRNYENLYTIDLICHGVYSKALLRKEISYWENRFSSSIFNFKFRSKRTYYWSDGGVINFDYTDKRGALKHFECHGCASPIYRCYAYSPDGKNYNLRPCCYTCHFRGSNRYGDLTVGDSWMVRMKSWKERMFIDEKNGTSLVSINSSKGAILFKEIEALLTTRDIEKLDAFRQPALLATNKSIPQERSTIYATIQNGMNIGVLEEKIFGIDFRQVLSTYNRMIRKQHLIRNLKKIIKKILS